MNYVMAGLNILATRSLKVEKTERSDTTNLQSSIFNIVFPDKAGSPLRADRLARVG